MPSIIFRISKTNKSFILNVQITARYYFIFRAVFFFFFLVHRRAYAQTELGGLFSAHCKNALNPGSLQRRRGRRRKPSGSTTTTVTANQRQCRRAGGTLVCPVVVHDGVHAHSNRAHGGGDRTFLHGAIVRVCVCTRGVVVPFTDDVI